MSDLTSRPYHPDPKQCCEACVFGGTLHEAWCPRSLAAAKRLREYAAARPSLLGESKTNTKIRLALAGLPLVCGN